MNTFLVDSLGRIGFDTRENDGPFRESLFWFSEDLNQIHCPDGHTYVDNDGFRMGLLNDRLSPLDNVFQYIRDQLILARTNDTLKLQYFCEDFTKLELRSVIVDNMTQPCSALRVKV